MSDSTPSAVFLSYASQDAEAARRICDALRAAGVEVWFDQNELTGGDAWDQKIRKQIRECALLIPVISKATQGRREAYFRLEWKLADERTHLMAKGTPFLLPVTIDGTSDRDALVPDSFLAVQWTRLPDGEGSAAFAQRVKKLLGGEPAGAALRREGEGKLRPRSAAPRKSFPRWLGPTILGAAVIAALMIWSPWQQKEKMGSAPMASPSPAASAGSPETARIRARLIPDRWQKGDLEALSPTLDRIIQANPEDSDAWALRSITNSLQVTRNIDSGTKPLEAGKAAAEHARRLAPDSPLAELALGMHLNAMISRGGDPLAGRPHVSRAVAALPPDALTRYADLVTSWQAYDFEDTKHIAEAWLATEPKAVYPNWIIAQFYLTRRQPMEAEKWAEAAAADRNVTGTRAIYTLFESKYYLRADLSAATEVLARVPPEGRTVHRVIHARWLLAMAGQHWDEALQELARVPESMLYDRTYHGPRSLLAGLAHHRAGRADAALAQFREAERLLRAELATDADNEELHLVLALTLACAGRATDARSELGFVEPLLKGRVPSIYWGAQVIAIAQTYGVLGDFGSMAEWLRKLFVLPNGFPFTPASLRLDPRFAGMLEAPEIQALLKEFASLDQAQPVAAEVALDQKSVAVLAFANLSDDKANEYFSDGISEELLNVLAKVPKLKVTARTSSFSFKGQNVPIPEIAQKLGVAYVVEGSVRKAGSKVRITAQLIKAADGFHVWSETYDRELKDIFAVQDEIAKNILGVVKGSLLGEAELPHLTTTKIEAYTIYLQAQGAFAKRGEVNLREAIRLFEAALAIDPDYVPALVGRAQAGVVLPNYAYVTGAQAREMSASATQAARRALKLDPQNAKALTVIGWAAFQFDWRWEEGTAGIARARDLAPNDSWTWNCLGDCHRMAGDVVQGLKDKQRVWELDPLSPVTHWDLGYSNLVGGRYAEAIRWANLTIAISPRTLDSYMPGLLAAGRAGRFDEMHRMLALARQNMQEGEGMLHLTAAHCAIMEKDTAEARRLLTLASAMTDKGQVPPAYLGYLYLLLGEADQALVWLQRASDQHDPSLVWIEQIDLEVIAANPMTRPILDQPQLNELREIRQRNARAGLNKL